MNASTNWRYVFNTFESNTRDSNIIMLSLSSDTHAKLKNEEANAVIAAILADYEPAFFAYRDLSEQYSIKSGEYEGTTLGFEEYLDLMPPKLKEWEGIIRAIYNEDTPEEKAIFPNKRVPFESGTYEKRLEALGALKTKVTNDPALSAAVTTVTSFYNAASGARLVQQMTEGAVGQLSDLRENQRLLLSEELMGVLGELMSLYRHDLVQVERYFDLSLLRDTGNDDEEEILNGNIPANTVIAPIDYQSSGFNFPSTTVVQLKNTSTNGSNLIFYPSNTQDGLPGAGTQYFLNAGQTLDKTFAELGSEGFLFLCIYNQNAMAASWEIEILE